MSWATLHPDIQAIATQHLTPAQLETWKLELAGRSQRDIALHFDRSRGTIQDRLDGVYRTLRRHGVEQDGSGHWTRKDTAA